MKTFKHIIGFAAAGCGLLLCTAAAADPPAVVHAGTTQTTFSATVAQQITVDVPSAIAFDVEDITADTLASAPATVAVTAMALVPGAYLKIFIVADAAAFTAPDGGSSWDAGDVYWVASTGTNFTGVSGRLNASAPQETGYCAVNANVCATTDLVFRLRAKGNIAAGEHTLGVHWKFEVL